MSSSYCHVVDKYLILYQYICCSNRRLASFPMMKYVHCLLILHTVFRCWSHARTLCTIAASSLCTRHTRSQRNCYKSQVVQLTTPWIKTVIKHKEIPMDWIINVAHWGIHPCGIHWLWQDSVSLLCCIHSRPGQVSQSTNRKNTIILLLYTCSCNYNI